MYIHICIYTYIYVYIWIYTYMNNCICIYIYMCLYIYVYIYKYIRQTYTYKHTHTHLYIYTHANTSQNRKPIYTPASKYTIYNYCTYTFVIMHTSHIVRHTLVRKRLPSLDNPSNAISPTTSPGLARVISRSLDRSWIETTPVRTMYIAFWQT